MKSTFLFLFQGLAYSAPWEFRSQPVTLRMTASGQHMAWPPSSLSAVYVASGAELCGCLVLPHQGILKGLPKRTEKEMICYAPHIEMLLFGFQTKILLNTHHLRNQGAGARDRGGRGLVGILILSSVVGDSAQSVTLHLLAHHSLRDTLTVWWTAAAIILVSQHILAEWSPCIWGRGQELV